VLSTHLEDDLWVVTLDDGNRNALRPETFEALAAAFDDAPDRAGAIVLVGREGMFTAGLDVKWMAAAGVQELADMLVLFGRTLMRVWTEPRPTVCAIEGHAVAAGTMFAMACDHAVAAHGDWKLGLTETRIDFQIPDFGLELARHNVAAHRVDDLLLAGVFVDPVVAAHVGFVDDVVEAEEVRAVAFGHARALAELPPVAYAGTKRRLRGAAAQRVLDGIDADVAAMVAESPVGRGAAQ